MTKDEAITAMKEGKKVTHTFFTLNEWMTLDSNRRVEFEDGCKCSLHEFWDTRQGAAWQVGWSIVEFALKPEYQARADEYDELKTLKGGCTCFQNAPCSLCVHPGNPVGLAETAEAWEIKR